MLLRLAVERTTDIKGRMAAGILKGRNRGREGGGSKFLCSLSINAVCHPITSFTLTYPLASEHALRSCIKRESRGIGAVLLTNREYIQSKACVAPRFGKHLQRCEAPLLEDAQSFASPGMAASIPDQTS